MDDTKERIREVLRDIPEQEFRPGHPINWGPPGNKACARALSARLGHVYDRKCTSCDFDLYTVLKHAAR